VAAAENLTMAAYGPTAAGVSGFLNGGFDLSAAQAAASMAEGQQASVPIQSLLMLDQR